MEELDNQELAANLKKAMSRLTKALRREMRKNDSYSLTELSTLSSIYKQPQIIPSELAAQEKVTNQSMSQIIKKLSDDGYIKKTRSEKDRRKILITMTHKGKVFVEQKIHKKKAWLAQAIADKTTQSERKILEKTASILTKLAD